MAKKRKRIKKRRDKNKDRILNVIPSPDTEKDWRYSHAEEAGIIRERAAARLPTSKDLRQTWWDIRNQGGTGACVGFATADSVLRWQFAQAGKLGKTSTKDKDKLSPRFTWMASKETDRYTSYPTTMIERTGTWLKAALEVSRKFGAVRESDLQFQPEKLWDGSRSGFFSTAAQFKISSYYNLSHKLFRSRSATLHKWRNWIAKIGPILTRLDVDATWDNVTSNGKLDTYKRNTKRGGHAVALVGYTKDRFIVRNSWGPSWGHKGYGYASLAYTKAAFTEAYGVKI
ncbi:MAG: C1 family peptidase [Planctomycetes bacterium]|nr:C1 family peptidase [Planctomycetota bacterium]